MVIVVNLDVMLAKRKMKLKELSQIVGITVQNLSVLKSGRAKAVRLSTLTAICQSLNCQPGDLLEFRDDNNIINASTYYLAEYKRQSSPL